MKVKHNKKWLALLAFCMTMFAVPFTVHAAAGEIWVNGVDIAKAGGGQTVQCGDGTAVYDANAGTLTLNNATLSETGNGNGVIDIPENMPLTIVLINNNKITNAEGAALLVSFSDLTISGEGSLTMEGKGEGISINNSKLTIDGTNVTVNIDSVSYSATGIFSGSDMIVKDSTVVSNSYGYKFKVNGNMLISNSEVKGGVLNNTDGTTACKVMGWLTIENHSSVILNNYTSAIESDGDIKISDSIVNAISDISMGIGRGIFAQDSLTITGDSEVTATGFSGSIAITNTAALTPPPGKRVEIMAGENESSAASLTGSPFTGQVDLKPLNLESYKYFHSKPLDGDPSLKEETATITATATTTDPAYTITIPPDIPVGEISQTAASAIKSTPFDVKAADVGNLNGKQVNVTVSTADGSFNLTDKSSNKLPYQVFNQETGGTALTNDGLFTSFTKDGTVTGRVDIDQKNIVSAGEYTGILTFTIALDDQI